MEVERSKPGNFNYGSGEDFERHHGNDVRAARPERFVKARVVQRRWLQNFDSGGKGRGLDGRRADMKAPPNRLIRGRDDTDNLSPVPKQRLQTRDGEVGRPHEHDAWFDVTPPGQDSGTACVPCATNGGATG